MNLDLIKTFLSVYQLGSFQKAAEQLFLPQPTVSHRMNQLETMLGTKLIVRNKGENRLTIEGKAFVPFALKMVEAFDQGQLAIEEISKGAKGRLVLGSTNSISAYILPDIIKQFLQKFPHIDVKVDSYSTEEIINRVKMRKFQIGFTRFSLNESSLTFRLISSEQIYLIVPRSHHYASWKSVTLKEVVMEPLILYQKSTQYRDTVDFTFNRFNIPYHVKYEMNNLELIKQLVAADFGVTLFAPSYMRSELESGVFVKIPIEKNPFPIRQTFMIYNEKELNSVDKFFINHMQMDFSLAKVQ
jgi:DNA-binding transcriptional LysR family regulator